MVWPSNASTGGTCSPTRDKANRRSCSKASNSLPLAWRTALHGTGTPKKCAMHHAAAALPVLRSGRWAVLVQTLSVRRKEGWVGIKVGGLSPMDWAQSLGTETNALHRHGKSPTPTIAGMNQHPNLFEPTTVGAWHLSNRVVMAPLTRNRAPGQLPTA